MKNIDEAKIWLGLLALVEWVNRQKEKKDKKTVGQL